MRHTSARLDYGLRALAVLAAAGTPVKADHIAAKEGLPPRFLEQVLGDLRRAGLVHSRRGGKGGYWLTRPADTITVGDVLSALDGRRLGSNGRATPMASVWSALDDALMEVAGRISLLDVAAGVSAAGTSPPLTDG